MFDLEFDGLPLDVRRNLERQLEQAVRLIARREKASQQSPEKPLTAAHQSAIINAIFDLATQFRVTE